MWQKKNPVCIEAVHFWDPAVKSSPGTVVVQVCRACGALRRVEVQPVHLVHRLVQKGYQRGLLCWYPKNLSEGMGVADESC